MRILFIHQNCPAQFKYLAPRLAAERQNEVWYITREGKPALPGVTKAEYKLSRQATEKIHPYVKPFEEQILYGQAAARAAVSVKAKGFVPDVVFCHPGWGEGLFIKDVFPDTKLLNYTEFYYNAFGADVHFEPGQKVDLDRICRIRAKNANNLLSLAACDWAIAPTKWQWSQNPAEFRSKISVIHDGINAEVCAPIDDAELKLPNGKVLRKGQEIVTYVSRNLEPYRGFPIYMKVLERLCRSRPNAQFVVVGGDGVSYGSPLPDKKTYREELLKQVQIDPDRVHFLGQVPYANFLKVLQVSSCHVYLTYPFVLSWSFLEAMSTGCVIVGSRTPPVQEVLVDRENGLLADFFDDAEIAERVEEVLSHPDGMAHIRRNARQTVLDSYQLKHCMARQIALLRDLAAGRIPPGERAPTTL